MSNYTWPSHYGNDSLFLLAGYLVISAIFVFSKLIKPKSSLTCFIHWQVMASMVPLTFFLVGIIFTLYAMAMVGHIPQQRKPDPGWIGLGLVEFFVVWIIFLALHLIAYISLHHRFVDWNKKNFRNIALLISTVLWLAFSFFIIFDPSRFIEWLAD